MNNWQTTTTTTNGSTVTITYQTWSVQYVDDGLSSKERARRERSRKWLAKIKERHDKWFAEEMARLRQWSIDNAWRPDVSIFPKNTPFALHCHTITATNEEDDMEPKWRTIYRRYMNGWLGLSLNDPSPYERERIDAFLKTIRKKDLLIDRDGTWLEWDSRDQFYIGPYTALQLGVWFRNLEDHNRFVELVESFEVRSVYYQLGEAADRDALRLLLQGENYLILDGETGGCLTMPPSSPNVVLAKMFVG